MNKDIKILLGFIVATFALIDIGCLLIPLIAFNDAGHYKKEFKENKDSFLYFAEMFKEIYEEADTDEMIIRVEAKGENYQFEIIYDEEEEYIEFTDEMLDKYEGVKDAFGDLYWNRTTITEQGISFVNEGNHYAFVYTFDGDKPEYMNVKGERFQIKSKSLGDGCYFVKSYIE